MGIFVQVMKLDRKESDRILTEFRRRDASLEADAYSLSRAANLFFHQGRVRTALTLLRRAGFFPCRTKCVLEIGCGARGWLPDFEAWGVPRGQLAGIDLDETRVLSIQRLLSGYLEPSNAVVGSADIRVGDASRLPWSSETFDAVVQSTVLTSVLADESKREIAREMLRVVKTDGLIVWYDFAYNNPANPNVQGIALAEIRRLFPGCSIRSRWVTLAPPLARWIVPASWLFAEFIQALRVFNTHRLVIIKKQ